MYDRSNRIMHCKAQIRMLKGEWCHSMLHTLYYILVIMAQVVSVARDTDATVVVGDITSYVQVTIYANYELLVSQNDTF